MKSIKKLLIKTDYQLDRYYPNHKSFNINIGAGRWMHPKWLSLDLQTDWYHQDRSYNFIGFDITKDQLPFEDNSVDLAYCSHVIEHLPDYNIEKLFSEIVRVLKPGGGLRLTCPDSKFIYLMSLKNSGFWAQRYYWAQGEQSTQRDLSLWEPFDFLCREIATPRCRFYKHKIEETNIGIIKNLNYIELMRELTKDLIFNPQSPGNHINWWDSQKIKSKFADFPVDIYESKYGGSIFEPMQDTRFFDNTCPWMSLYLDIVKIED